MELQARHKAFHSNKHFERELSGFWPLRFISEITLFGYQTTEYETDFFNVNALHTYFFPQIKFGLKIMALGIPARRVTKAYCLPGKGRRNPGEQRAQGGSARPFPEARVP